jgi:hypothetical protein
VYFLPKKILCTVSPKSQYKKKKEAMICDM